MFIFVPSREYYLKKEDVKKFYKFQHIKIGIILVATTIALGSIHFWVSPKILEMYSDLGQTIASSTQIAYKVLSGLLILLLSSGVFYLFSSPDEQKLTNELKKYKSGEMISTKKLMDGKLELLIFFLIAISVAFTIIANVVPIYSLTSQF